MSDNPEFSALAEWLGLNEFQKIALREAMRDAEGIEWPPKTPEEEEKLRRIGAIAGENLWGAFST